MSLSKLNIPSYEVEYGGQKLAFQGLSFNMLVGLIRNHKSELDKLYEMATTMGDDDDLSTVLIAALEDMPELAASVIAYSAGEPDMVEVAAKLPFTVQIEIIEQIYDLTLREVGGMGKFLTTVTKIFKRVRHNPAQESIG